MHAHPQALGLVQRTVQRLCGARVQRSGIVPMQNLCAGMRDDPGQTLAGALRGILGCEGMAYAALVPRVELTAQPGGIA
ncbi:hypothetical protein XPN_3249 [Xanthomonas arboricola pv. pruni MAFF 301427]|nr:hypothetical protein XPN_3249 [Xanthomonas arboricola pv. pruni MAFF 301427]